MACASQAGLPGTSSGSSLLHDLLSSWQRHLAAFRKRPRLAVLDNRALSDLALQRDGVLPRHVRDDANLWLVRLSAGG